MQTQKSPKVTSGENEIELKDTPMFIVVGSDDNGLVDRGGSGALTWFENYLQDKKNPCGSNRNEFDGIPVRFAFYVTARYGLRRGFEDKESVLAAWSSLYENGHELGNHGTEHLMTVQNKEDVHFDGTCYTEEEWYEKEFGDCHALLTGKTLRIPETSLKGWRTPRFSEWNNNIFQLLEDQGYLYDSSLEYFSDSGEDFIWPHSLEKGSEVYPELNNFKSLWELPIYNLILPDQVKSKIEEGQIGRPVTVDLDFFLNTEKGGLGLNGEDYFQTLRHTLQQRLKGNRCPFIVNIHSDIYSARRDNDCTSTTTVERQMAIENFIKYALDIPEVRFVTPIQLIKWLKKNR